MSAPDPTRLLSLADRCDTIMGRLGGVVSERVCEDVEQLDHLHDRLAYEVENLAAILHETLVALAGPE